MYKQYDKDVLKKLQNVQLEILSDFIDICEKNNLDYFLVFGTALGAVRHKGFIPWDDDVDVGMLREDYNKFLEIAKMQLSNKYEILTPLTNKEYACSVTHFEKKNTSFIPETSKDLKCNMGINIDIFAFDNIADEKFKKNVQAKKAWFLGRLLFLRGTAHPIIPIKGIRGEIAKIICVIAHYILVIFNISAPFIYKKLLKVSKKYNNISTEYVTCFEDFAPINDMIRRKDIFPLKKIKFENLEVNVPNKNHELLTGMYGDYMKIPPKDKRINHCPYVLDFGEENEGKGF